MTTGVLQSAALALAFIGGAYLLVFVGRGINWLTWKYGGKHRAAKDAALDARVRAELTPGETLLWVGRWRSQLLSGSLFTFFSLPFILAVVFHYNGKQPILMVYLLMFGLFMMNVGTFFMFRRNRNYFFVTSRRLAFRGRSLMGLRIHKDVQSHQIRGVTLIDFQMYSIHLHYRVRVAFDNGKGKTRLQEILPERDPEYFAGAIQRIWSASSRSMF